MKVAVVYALQDRQFAFDLDLPDGATVAEALARSGICETVPEAARAKVGIFGKVTSRDAVLQTGDRVEIYRPLIQEPKEARRHRIKPR